MGKAAKRSRKGKKAWRANISTADIDEYFEKSTKDALSGASTAIAAAPSESLFFVDKSTNDIPAKRKIEKKREKVLNLERVLQRNEFVQPVPSSTVKKSKRKIKPSKKKMEGLDIPKAKEEPPAADLDLWNEKGDLNAKVKKKTPTQIPAVEVEPAGCSFNPSFEAHQDSLAQAVAVEMQKIYKKELQPEPVPLTVPGQEIDEEENFFLDVDDANENDMDEDVDNADDELIAQRHPKTKRVTRVELNKRARRKEQLRAEADTNKKEMIHKEIDRLPDIIQQISKEDEEKKRRHVRRVIAKQERLKSGPPRLGKTKFEPAPPQVLLSEEITGSLRKLKGCCNLALDRFKSLQKRGLLVPTKKRR